MTRGEYPITEEIVDSLISRKILKKYFVALKNCYTLSSSEKSSSITCRDFSIELGMELIMKHSPHFYDEKKILGLKGSPNNVKPPYNTDLKEAALDIESRLGVTPAFASVHFSVLKQQSFIPIHADDKSKILSTMLYLATPDQHNNVNLGTSFWSPNNLQDQIYDAGGYKNRPNDEEENRIRNNFTEQKSTFANGSIVSFLRTSTAWHSFFYDGPNLGPRVSLNLNIHSFY